MFHRIPKRLDGLRRNHRLAATTDGGGDHDRQNLFVLLEHFLNRHECRLGVERIKDGFHEQQVRAARDKSANLIRVGRFYLIERADAETCIIRIGRVREGNGQRPDRTRNETRPTSFVRNAVRPLAALLGGLFVNLPSKVIEESVLDDPLVKRRVFATTMFTRVVHEEFALPDARGGKCIRLNDVRTGFQKAPMNVANCFRLRERIKVTVVLQIFLGILEPFAANFRLAVTVSANSRPHRAVNVDDAFAERTLQQFGVVRHAAKIDKAAANAN